VGFSSLYELRMYADAASEILRLHAEGQDSELEAADDILRERWETALSHAVRDSVEQLVSLQEEESILAFAANRQADSGEQAAHDSRAPPVVPPEERRGIQVTHLDRNVDGSITERRQVVKGEVFRPFHNLPTMSLEDFAEQEYQDAMRRQEAQKAAENNKGPRRMDQLERDGDEDDAELVEQAARKVRWRRAS